MISVKVPVEPTESKTQPEEVISSASSSAIEFGCAKRAPLNKAGERALKREK